MKTFKGYEPIKIRGRLTRVDNRRAKRESRPQSEKSKTKKINIRDPRIFYRPAYHTEVIVNGLRLKVVNRTHLAKFLGVTYGTILKWYKAGVFGNPIYSDTNSFGSQRQYWLVKQMSCFIIVLNDILRGGYLNINWNNFPDQVEAIHKGFEHHAELLFKRLDKAAGKDDNTDRFGVEFLDDG